MPFFNPEARLIIRRGKLPHWRQEGVVYFVTFRLADSLPQAKLEWLQRKAPRLTSEAGKAGRFTYIFSNRLSSAKPDGDPIS
jgi:hypothetical protein